MEQPQDERRPGFGWVVHASITLRSDALLDAEAIWRFLGELGDRTHGVRAGGGEMRTSFLVHADTRLHARTVASEFVHDVAARAHMDPSALLIDIDAVEFSQRADPGSPPDPSPPSPVRDPSPPSPAPGDQRP